MKCCVYRIVNTATNRCYVGSAVDVSTRWAVHVHLLNAGRHHSRKLQRSWLKHGALAFRFEIVESVGDKESLIAREQFWIDALKGFGDGYNMAPKAGSTIGVRPSPETRAKQSAAKKGKPGRLWTEEQKKKLSMTRILRGHGRRKHTPEERSARALFTTGRRHSLESRKKMSDAVKAGLARRKLMLAGFTSPGQSFSQ